MAIYIFRSNYLLNTYLTTQFSFENKSKSVILFFNLLEVEKKTRFFKFTIEIHEWPALHYIIDPIYMMYVQRINIICQTLHITLNHSQQNNLFTGSRSKTNNIENCRKTSRHVSICMSRY